MDIRKIKKLIELLEESNIGELEIKEGEESVRIARNSGTVQYVNAPMQGYAPAPAQQAAAPAPAAGAARLARRDLGQGRARRRAGRRAAHRARRAPPVAAALIAPPRPPPPP